MIEEAYHAVTGTIVGETVADGVVVVAAAAVGGGIIAGAAAMGDTTFELPIVGERDGVWMAFGLPPSTLEPHGFPRSVEIDLGDKPSQEVCFLCDDLDATIEELQAKGVEFQGEPKDMG